MTKSEREGSFSAPCYAEFLFFLPYLFGQTTAIMVVSRLGTFP